MVIVYTAILGGCDSLKAAPKGADRCVCFTDDPALVYAPRGWDIEPFHTTAPRRDAWHLRCVPHELFDRHVASVWVDASFTVTDLPRLMRAAEGHALSGLRHHSRASCYDEGREVVRVGQADARAVAEQLAGYEGEGFAPTALTISCVLVRANTRKVAAFNDAWDREIRQHAGDNTQISLDYCAWKTGVGVFHLEGVRKDNPYAEHDHADHKRRRKPYR